MKRKKFDELYEYSESNSCFDCKYRIRGVIYDRCAMMKEMEVSGNIIDISKKCKLWESMYV